MAQWTSDEVCGALVRESSVRASLLVCLRQRFGVATHVRRWEGNRSCQKGLWYHLGCILRDLEIKHSFCWVWGQSQPAEDSLMNSGEKNRRLTVKRMSEPYSNDFVSVELHPWIPLRNRQCDNRKRRRVVELFQQNIHYVEFEDSRSLRRTLWCNRRSRIDDQLSRGWILCSNDLVSLGPYPWIPVRNWQSDIQSRMRVVEEVGMSNVSSLLPYVLHRLGYQHMYDYRKVNESISQGGGNILCRLFVI
jgi:hypothetical protein